MTRASRRPAFELGDQTIPAGKAAVVELPIPRLVTGADVSLPVRVIHGRADGPTIWISAAVHGDEIAGVEIIRRVVAQIDPRRMGGTLITVPIVNVYGFLNDDRYLPDRRDLNRSFPGSATGSLARRVANEFMVSIVSRCDIGIDLHTGSDHRTNLPQVRADLSDPYTAGLAMAFGAPVALDARLRDGSLRAAASAHGITMLLYEGGEAMRFDRDAIRVGTEGVLRVLRQVEMLDPAEDGPAGHAPVVCRSSSWVRTRRSGIALIEVDLGECVERGTQLAVVHDSLGRRLSRARAPFDGIVIGRTEHPLVHQGDAIVHIARTDEHPDGTAGADAADDEHADTVPAHLPNAEEASP